MPPGARAACVSATRTRAHAAAAREQQAKGRAFRARSAARATRARASHAGRCRSSGGVMQSSSACVFSSSNADAPLPANVLHHFVAALTVVVCTAASCCCAASVSALRSLADVAAALPGAKTSRDQPSLLAFCLALAGASAGASGAAGASAAGDAIAQTAGARARDVSSIKTPCSFVKNCAPRSEQRAWPWRSPIPGGASTRWRHS